MLCPWWGFPAQGLAFPLTLHILSFGPPFTSPIFRYVCLALAHFIPTHELFVSVAFYQLTPIHAWLPLYVGVEASGS